MFDVENFVEFGFHLSQTCLKGGVAIRNETLGGDPDWLVRVVIRCLGWTCVGWVGMWLWGMVSVFFRRRFEFDELCWVIIWRIRGK